MDQEIIIIGAGAAGLMAAFDLSFAGKKVLIIEGRDRIGGRIHTIPDPTFPLAVELGAEYIHGDLPLTKDLLKKYKLEYYKMKGDLVRFENGHLQEQDDFVENVGKVIKRLKELETDVSLDAFLERYFSDQQHETTKKILKGYVEGYEAADTSTASSFALLEEFLTEDDPTQYRIRGGYIELINRLHEEVTRNNVEIVFNTVVKEIIWKKDKVSIVTNGKSFQARQVLVTVPVGVLKKPDGAAAIIFNPALYEIDTAISQLGYGGVIKSVYNFSEPIWKKINHKFSPAFIFSDEEIPTWWTQLPEENGMITGWLAGPRARALYKKSNDELKEKGLRSLSRIFQIPKDELEKMLTGYHIANWINDPFSSGAYGYETVGSKKSKSIINAPIHKTIYFAGEGIYEGPERGTVEAALMSGRKAAAKILEQ